MRGTSRPLADDAASIQQALDDCGAAGGGVVLPEQPLPPSLYLDRAPDSFGATPWPPIGPDVSGYVHDIPAKIRFDEIQGG
jgi:hypothetical protein